MKIKLSMMSAAHFFSMRRALVLFFCLGIFVLPFVYSPKSMIVFEVPRVWFFLRWAEVLGCIVLCIFQREKILAIDLNMLRLLGMFLCIAILSGMLGVDIQNSFFGNYYRFDGLITLAHLVAFSIWVGFFFDQQWLKYFFASLLAATVFLDSGVIWLGLTRFPMPVGLTFGQANFLAGYLLVSLPVVLFLMRKMSKPFGMQLGLIVFFLTISAIILTQSIGAIIGVGLLVCLLLLIYLRDRGMKWMFPTMIFFFLLFAAVAYIPFKNSYVAESRERIVRKLLPAIVARPVLGWGWSNVDPAFQSVVWPAKYEQDIRVDKAHSTILESFVTMGLMGGTLYCIVLFFVGKKLYGRARSTTHFGIDHILLLMFILFVYHAQTNVISISEEILFWFLVGASLKGVSYRSIT